VSICFIIEYVCVCLHECVWCFVPLRVQGAMCSCECLFYMNMFVCVYMGVCGATCPIVVFRVRCVYVSVCFIIEYVCVCLHACVCLCVACVCARVCVCVCVCVCECV